MWRPSVTDVACKFSLRPIIDGRTDVRHVRYGFRIAERHGELRRHLGEVFRKLAVQKESKIEEGHLCLIMAFGAIIGASNPIKSPKTEGTDHLPWKDQIMLRIAGMAAEEFFNFPEDPRASLHDRGEIARCSTASGMSEEREARIAEGNARARIILEEHREQALRLVACLVEHGHVNEPEFLRLMSGE